MEPITYANGSTLEDPAISYGIVFSNFMSKGVFTFQGGTDRLIGLMKQELERNGVDLCIRSEVQKIHVRHGRVEGVTVNGRTIPCRAVISNANLKSTIFHLAGEEHFDRKFVDDARAVRLNNSSTQVYMALRPGEMIDESCGDLLFSSKAPLFRTELLLNRNISSRTYSFYYPRTRPGSNRCLVVSSTNAHYQDWAGLPEEEYQASKRELIEGTLADLAKYIPDIREKLEYVEASTPRTFEHYTRHVQGASFGTKFEGLAVSRALPEQVSGLYHAGSVGIIMSGWLGAMNYGVIVSNDVDAYLVKGQPAGPQVDCETASAIL
jgi:phytoene dehydrogenase-like protein